MTLIAEPPPQRLDRCPFSPASVRRGMLLFALLIMAGALLLAIGASFSLLDRSMSERVAAELHSEAQGVSPPLLRQLGRPSEPSYRLGPWYVALGLLFMGAAAWLGRGLVAAVAEAAAKREEAETALAESERRSSPMLEGSSQCVYETDLSGALSFLSPAWYAITGYSVEECLGRRFIDFMSLPDQAQAPQRLAEAREKDAARVAWIAHYVHKNGQMLQLEQTLCPARDDHGNTVGLCGSLNDQTRLWKAGQALTQAREDAAQARRAKSDFLSNVSHEMRTPMNGIMGLTQLTLETDLTPLQRDYLGKVLSSAQALLGVVNDILDVSKIEAGRMDLEYSDFALDDLVRNVSGLFEVTARQKRLWLRFAVTPAAPVRVSGDLSRLGQVLNNLVGNALKFTENGGVTVTIRHQPAGEGRVRLECSVRDTGIGMDEEQLARLFQPFTQADGTITRRYGGSGLGLSICQKLVHLMGGDISAHSVPGEGSTFAFNVLLEPPTLAQQKTGGPHEWGPDETVTGARILLVEDNKASQPVAFAYMRRCGFSITVAGDGREALDRLRGESFDAVLMDLQMPGMGGIEASRAIRAIPGCADLPIIAMAAAAMPEDRNLCLATGMNDLLAKPFDAEQLTAILRKWVRKEPQSPQQSANAVRQPHLPGFDLAAALERLGGDKETLNQVLSVFLEDLESTLPQIKRALEHGDAEELRRLVHRVKGASGSAGAETLREAATRLEQELKAGALPILAPTLPAFRTAMTAASRALSPYAEKPQEEAAVYDAQRADGLLEELRVRIAGSEYVSQELVGCLRQALSPVADGIMLDGLVSAVENCDYVHARQLLERIAESRPVSTSPSRE